MYAISRVSPSFLLLLLLLLVLFGLSGCGKQTVPPADGGYQSGSTGTGTATTPGTKPYTVMGKTYYPLSSADGFREEGIASWYGKDFHGKQTANGERYDMYGMTAAHKLLPFGTMVRVTSKTNGRSIVVRINDRGPFVDNRIIDLTHTGAKELDMLTVGTMPVKLETIGEVKGLQNGKLQGRFYVQVGSFSIEENATKLVQKLRAQGLSARSVYVSSIGFWRVQVGPYSDLPAAEKSSQSLVYEYQHNFIVAD